MKISLHNLKAKLVFVKIEFFLFGKNQVKFVMMVADLLTCRTENSKNKSNVIVAELQSEKRKKSILFKAGVGAD